ncbi:MAG: hypothetical protein FJ109_09260 [Deltaproteobacteria bacterium]|nr:hypothetical protein [Deltaproteobacteria bacterium]
MQAEKTAARKGPIARGMMGKGDKSNLLLTSLEEIKKSSAEEDSLPKAAVPTPEPIQVPQQKSGAGNLLDSLLSDVRVEAEREVEEITRTLKEKTAAERRAVEEEEQRKKAQYDKLIQEEARRRQSVIQKREDDKRRKELEERRREEARLQLIAEQARLKKRRRVLLAASGAGLAALVAVVVLVVTGIIPLGPQPGQESQPGESQTTVPAVTTQTGVAKKTEQTGRAIGDTELEPLGNIDGQGGVVLDIPERNDVDSFVKPHPLRVQPLRLQVDQQPMRERVAKAFVATSSGGSSKPEGEVEGGIRIDDSIFDINADKNKKKKR